MSEQQFPETTQPVWMRCPYDADLCGAEATLTEFTVADLNAGWRTGWRGRLECVNGHVFVLSQEAVDG